MSGACLKRPKGAVGYTVVEFLVVMAVIVLLAGMMLAGYLRFDRKRKVEEAALGFAQFLQAQKKRASSGDTEGCDPLFANNVLAGYNVNVTSGSGVAWSEPDCITTIGAVTNYSLVNDTSFDGGYSFKFLPLSRGAEFAPPNTSATTEVFKGNYRFRVTVDAQGAITVEEVP